MPVTLLVLVGAILIAALVTLVGHIWLMVLAFVDNKLIGTGLLAGLTGVLASACLGPLASPLILTGLVVGTVYALKNWDRTRLPFLMYAGGVVVQVACAGLMVAVAPSALADMRSRLPGQGEDVPMAAPSPAADRPLATAPPAPPAATPTFYLPAPLADHTPLARSRPRLPTPLPDDDFHLTVDTAHQRVGWTMSVTLSDGREFQGVLLRVDESSLHFQRFLGRGEMIFPVAKKDVVKLELEQ